MNKHNDTTIERITEDLDPMSWETLFNFRKHCCQVSNRPFKLRSFEEFKRRKLYMLKKGIGIYVVWNEKKGGFFSFKLGCKNNIEKRHIRFENELISNRIDEILFKNILREFVDYDDRSKYFVYTTDKQDCNYYNKMLPTKLGEIRELYELNVTSLDMEIIEKWYNIFQNDNRNYTIRFYNELPEDLIISYSKLLTELINEVDFKSELFDYSLTKKSAIINRNNFYNQVNYKWYQYLLFDDQENLIGMTDAFINANNPKVISQSMTGIKSTHRGKGLSKWLKSAMIKKIIQDFPETKKLITAIHPKNFIPKKINTEIGFRKYKESNELLILRNEIIKYCNL